MESKPMREQHAENRDQTRETRLARMRHLANEAMTDPAFVADMHDVMAAFESVDRANWPLYEDEGSTHEPALDTLG